MRREGSLKKYQTSPGTGASKHDGKSEDTALESQTQGRRT